MQALKPEDVANTVLHVLSSPSEVEVYMYGSYNNYIITCLICELLDA